ncbi:uncharacterized protein [Henckelia pumila]|uniref:uncharacterized protein n=1 Tax=Henckelia pumila TaxID=405737 RepID=UPI003C6E40D5
MKNFSLVVGMKFKSAKEFREVLRDHSVRHGYELVLKKNERTRITGEHNCARSNENKLANYRYLGKIIEKIIRYNCAIKIDQMKNLIKTKCGVDVSKWKVIRAKKAVVQKIRGVGCRPIIGLDGCFLKKTHDGQLLAAVDIGGMGEDKWTFISDRQKGLIEALKELAATTGNKNQFEEHLKKIAQVDPKLNESQETACEWLKKIPPVHWARSHFSSQCLSDCVVNNFSESFNSYIIDARDKPIITMLECLRNKLMKRIQVKKAGMEKYIGQICPNILKKINKNQKFSRKVFAIYSGEHEYQIQCLSVHGVLTQHVVDLVKKTCTCGMFQLCAYPCSHACTPIGHNRVKLEDFVHKCYSKDEYLKVYSHIIHDVPGESDYFKTPYQQLNAPIYKSKKGRPQRMRRRQADEETSVSTRRGITHTCSRCLEQFHNKATCKNPINPRFKYFKGTNEEAGGQCGNPETNAQGLNQEAHTQGGGPPNKATTDAIVRLVGQGIEAGNMELPYNMELSDWGCNSQSYNQCK